MRTKPSAKWAYAVVLASLLAVPVSFTAQAAEQDQETVMVEPMFALPSVTSPTLYKLSETAKPYKRIKIGNSDIIDVIPQTDRTFYLIPAKYGATNIMFFDDEDVMIKDLKVVVTHSVELLGVRGPRGHGLKSYYNCWNTGCQFVSEDKLELPTRPIDIKGGQPVAVTVGSGPSD